MKKFLFLLNLVAITIVLFSCKKENDDTVKDTTPPVITLLGKAQVNVNKGDAYQDAGATAYDETDGDITSKIVTTNPVDVNTEGTYIVRYNVSDNAGNKAVEVTRQVKVLVY